MEYSITFLLFPSNFALFWAEFLTFGGVFVRSDVFRKKSGRTKKRAVKL